MNYKSLYSILLLASTLVMSSCSDKDQEVLDSTTSENANPTTSEYVNSVRVTVGDFIPESATRTAYTVDAAGFHFQWADGDALGIYPVGGDQVKFPISAGDGTATASFDGGAWKLRSEYQYAAYYPFSADNYTIPETALPVSYTGQTQDGNGSTAHLGAYDYLACAATTPDANGGVDLTMEHLGAFVRLHLTLPQIDTYSKVVLESNGTQFVTAGTFDLTAATPAITSTATSSTYTINLTDVATERRFTPITVYAMVAPADLSNNNIKVTVHGAGKATYVQTIDGRNFEAGKAYNIAIDEFPTGTNASGQNVNWVVDSRGHEYVDLGLPSGTLWAKCNIGASAPEQYGDKFAWAEVATKSEYTQHTYKWLQNGETGTIARYWVSGQSYGTPDNRTVLLPEDDVAHVKWGGAWRMPTKAELDELLSECNWTWIELNGVNGFKFTSKVNDQYIFIPAFYNGRYSQYYCWSSSLNVDAPFEAYAFYVYSPYNIYTRSNTRFYGIPVRPVCK